MVRALSPKKGELQIGSSFGSFICGTQSSKFFRRVKYLVFNI